MSWTNWRRDFEDNLGRPTPEVAEAGVPEPARAPLARSLAIFQLGEAGEGRIAKEVYAFRAPTVDDDWRVALGHWVREEGRHGRILGDCVRALGGRPIATNWTNRLLIHGRRLLGLRLKLLVVLAAEIIGITFYGLLAGALPAGPIPAALRFIVEEEERHLRFHSEFFRREAGSALRRLLFRAAWWLVGSAAGAVVLADHARTLAALGVPRRRAALEFVRLLAATARTVCAPRPREWQRGRYAGTFRRAETIAERR